MPQPLGGKKPVKLGERLMLAIGIKLVSDRMYYAAVEGSQTSPTLVSKEDVHLPHSDNPGAYVDWAETQLQLLLDRDRPDTVRYKLTTPLAKHVQIFHVYFTLSILHLLAHRSQIECRHVTPSQLKPTNLGASESDTIDVHIKKTFGDQEAPWNQGVREAVAIALMGLD
jgi:hypothetical protein